jgi:hypothetical protein
VRFEESFSDLQRLLWISLYTEWKHQYLQIYTKYKMQNCYDPCLSCTNIVYTFISFETSSLN